MTLGDLPERIHLRGLAEQVHDHDRLGLRRDLVFDLMRIEVERHRIDVGEHRPGPDPAHGADAGKEGEGGQNDLIAGPNSKGVQAQQQGIGTRRTADAEAGAAIAGDFRFESSYFRTPITCPEVRTRCTASNSCGSRSRNCPCKSKGMPTDVPMCRLPSANECALFLAINVLQPGDDRGKVRSIGKSVNINSGQVSNAIFQSLPKIPTLVCFLLRKETVCAKPHGGIALPWIR